MDFAILGPLVVREGKRAVPIAARKQRVLLAVLLTRANQPAPVDLLVAAMWGERPPKSALENLRVYVHRLRRALGPEQRVTRRPPGYALAVRPGELDAERFDQLVAQGRRARGGNDAARASDLFSQALGLWRGPAFADVAEVAELGAEAARLHEARLAVLEARADLELALGRHEQLIPELRNVTAENPLRERPRAQLMLAYFRAGRQADALAMFDETRRVLADELGVDPGPELRHLHTAILRNEPRLAWPPRVGPGFWAARDTVRPAQLPTDVATFTGRTDELARLLALAERPATPAVRVGTVEGMAGVGKTALAVRAAHLLAPGFVDGQLFVDLRGFTPGTTPLHPADALARLLRDLGVLDGRAPRSVDELAALYRSHLAGRRALVVLDNAADEEQVEPLLPGAAGCVVLVTSRRRLAGLDMAEPLPLDTLPVADAVTLFVRTVGAARLGDAPAGLVEQVVELCGQLPLAIRIAAARLRHRPAWGLPSLAERLRNERHRLTELEAGQRSVADAFHSSYEQLDPVQRRMFRMLGRHSGSDIDRHLAATLVGTIPIDAERLLQSLADAHLLVEYRVGRYRFHDLIRHHAAQLANADESPVGPRQVGRPTSPIRRPRGPPSLPVSRPARTGRRSGPGTATNRRRRRLRR